MDTPLLLCLEMREISKEPRLEAVAGTIKWVTPWAECIAVVDSDGDLTLATSDSPSPVFTNSEWERFCSLVNERINLNTKDK